jgi:hypothetical protein
MDELRRLQILEQELDKEMERLNEIATYHGGERYSTDDRQIALLCYNALKRVKLNTTKAIKQLSASASGE